VDALMFHREIEAAVERHGSEIDYVKSKYSLMPFVGTDQPTLQASVLDGGILTPSRELPSGIDSLLAGGDGTVPRLSATPIELSEAYYDTFLVERHGGLQRNASLLADVLARIEQMQVLGLGAIREPEPQASDVLRQDAVLSVDIDDMYVSGEPVVVTADVTNASPVDPPRVQIQATSQPSDPTNWEMVRVDDTWQAVGELPAGLYRAMVICTTYSGENLAVQDLFAVAD
jgi:hypothetical protein